jgi:hypothetical protein
MEAEMSRQFHQFKAGDRVVIASGPFTAEIVEVAGNMVRINGREQGWYWWGMMTLEEDCTWFAEEKEPPKRFIGPFPTREDATEFIKLQSRTTTWTVDTIDQEIAMLEGGMTGGEGEEKD